MPEFRPSGYYLELFIGVLLQGSAPSVADDVRNADILILTSDYLRRESAEGPSRTSRRRSFDPTTVAWPARPHSASAFVAVTHPHRAYDSALVSERLGVLTRGVQNPTNRTLTKRCSAAPKCLAFLPAPQR